MLAIVTLLSVIAFSLVVTRIATIALMHTGLSEDTARFQARSALTGVGFTTHEAEGVVNHPVRRRIVMQLMLWGNAGLVTAISSLALTFVNLSGPKAEMHHAIYLGAGLVLLVAASRSRFVNTHLSRLITWALKRYTDIDVQDYVSLMHLGEFRINELMVEDDFWLVDKDLQTLGLKKLGLQVLGITRRDGRFVGTPSGTDEIKAGDRLLVYCRGDVLRSVDWRAAPASEEEKGADGEPSPSPEAPRGLLAKVRGKAAKRKAAKKDDGRPDDSG
ncbi:TrkA-C domain protein [Desulfovibrio sp. X2]|uniref:TrkA C-terminal domain-containing protein n=1 Tax=Desulfovibrio sp. X2 TaxID=941449 RepID=UPI0003588FDD|nr:TrkA C-terminal domain-containing protein [Desulfovibrio sp. X2]EPR44386.1 TrkA-C domain protein [Desulfovibrio sp. X2]